MKKISNFWNWFLDNQYTIKNFMNHTAENQEKICYWIKQNLKYYSNEIDFILVFPNNNNKSEFIITTNENSKTFKKAIALIDNARVLKDWKFTTLLKSNATIEKRLNKLDQPYVIQDINLKIDKVQHIPINLASYSKKQTIHIHLKNYCIHCSNKTLKQALFFILEEILANGILYENIIFVQLAQNTEEEISIIQLYELQQFMDNYKRR
jgi:hypothetical protein